MVSDVKYKPNASETNVIITQVIFMNLVLALSILVKPMTVDADANFLHISISLFNLLTIWPLVIDKIYFFLELKR